MDRSLDEIISERPTGPRAGNRAPPRGPRRDGPPPRAPRREEYPRDGVRKVPAPSYPNRGDDRVNLDSDWVHDRFDDDRYDRRRNQNDEQSNAPRRDAEAGGTKLKVDNLHYDLTEDDLRDLFERKGTISSVKLLYDRMDRSQGTAFVTFEDHRDARDAITDYDGQNANGQPIKITIVPTAPAGPKPGASLFDRIERPPRSLFDRIEAGRREDSREDVGRRRRNRSDSPVKGRATPDGIDRYVPGRRASRSPIRRRGTPRESGRRPGQMREESSRGGRGGRRGRADEGGRQPVGGRPRKTAEELDAEMADYWGGSANEASNGNGAAANGAAPASGDNDEDMVL